MTHAAAELSGQSTGQLTPQAVVVEQHHREAGLAQHQAPALRQQVLAVVGGVGQGLGRRGIERQGILQGRIRQAQLHLGHKAHTAAGRLRELAHQHGPALVEQPGHHPQGVQRLPVPLPLQQGGVDAGPAGPGVAGGGQPAGPGIRQGGERRQQLPQRRLLLRGDGRLLQRPTGTCQQPAAEALMQLQQAGRSAGQAAAQLLPVLRVDHHPQGHPQQGLKLLRLRHHQLTLVQQTLSPGPHQALVVQHPQPGRGRRRGAFPTGQMQAYGLQTRQLHLQQPLSQLRTHHQGHGLLVQGQGHQQAQQPTGITARSQTHQGLVSATQAAGHQPTQGEVMRPAGFPLQPEECLELLVGLGFQHRQIVGSWPQRTVQP